MEGNSITVTALQPARLYITARLVPPEHGSLQLEMPPAVSSSPSARVVPPTSASAPETGARLGARGLASRASQWQMRARVPRCESVLMLDCSIGFLKSSRSHTVSDHLSAAVALTKIDPEFKS